MATAISYKSESGDDYLKLYDNDETPKKIIAAEKRYFGDEWEYLEIIDIVSTDLDIDELRKGLWGSIQGLTYER